MKLLKNKKLKNIFLYSGVTFFVVLFFYYFPLSGAHKMHIYSIYQNVERYIQEYGEFPENQASLLDAEARWYNYEERGVEDRGGYYNDFKIAYGVNLDSLQVKDGYLINENGKKIILIKCRFYNPLIRPIAKKLSLQLYETMMNTNVETTK